MLQKSERNPEALQHIFTAVKLSCLLLVGSSSGHHHPQLCDIVVGNIDTTVSDKNTVYILGSLLDLIVSYTSN
eukprot:SAG11_NODE_1308_length_5239_cov_12.108366_2_plen_73_part_00